MIDVKTFKMAVDSINKHRKWQDRCTNFIEKEICTDSWAFVTAGDDLQSTLVKVLAKAFNDKGEWIDWWIFEDVEKVVGFADGTKKDISKIEDFYEFLLENKIENDKLDESNKSVGAC